MNDCARCGAKHACHGVGQPAQTEQRWYCGTCIAFQPSTQARLAREARKALDDPEILIR